MKSNDFSVGLMNETAVSASKAGWEPEDMASLSKNEDLLRLIRGVLLGTHQITEIEHIIDCDGQPYIPEGWKVEQHLKGGQIHFDASKIGLYLSPVQQKGIIGGYRLYEELKDMRMLNANVLDYLLANPTAIPVDWKDKAIFFWGTIYRTPDGHHSVRCLYWCDGRWRWSSDWLSISWNASNPAAIIPDDVV